MVKNLRDNYLTSGRLGNRVWRKVLCGQEIIDKAQEMAADRGIKLKENMSVKSAANFLASECFDDYKIEPYRGILKVDPLALYVGV